MGNAIGCLLHRSFSGIALQPITCVGHSPISCPRSTSTRSSRTGSSKRAILPRGNRQKAYNTCSIPDKYLPVFNNLGTVAYVVIQDSTLLFEQYWEDYSPESHSNSFSMAKSIVSLAVGCAIDDGMIQDVDQPVSDFSRIRWI